MSAVSPDRPLVAEVAGMVGSLVVVTALAALVLRGLDAIPGWVTGEERGIERFESVEGVERAYGEPLLLPAFFPDTLRWPPAAIRFRAGPPAAVATQFLGRDGGDERLAIVEARGARASIPMALMPSGVALHRVAVPMPEGEAALVRVTTADGQVRNDLVWYRPDSTVALRYSGSADELMTIAHSLQRRRR
jgi:hypothetical protein